MNAVGILLLLGAVAQQTDTTRADSAVVLRPLVVTATRAAEGPGNATPVAAAALSPAPADRGATRITPDLLRDLPGVHVQQTSAGQGAAVLRGLLGNQVLYLVNGIPMNNGTYRDGPGQYLATIDPETIERIEVVRGPASVLYGSDAQGGVVNVITRPHPGVQGWSVASALQGSSANYGGRARVSAGWQGPRLTVGFGASLVQAGDLRPGGGLPPQSPSGFSALGLDGRLTWQPDTAGRHRLVAGLEHFGMHDVPRYDRYVDFRAPAEGPDFRHVFDPQTRQLGFIRHRYRGNGTTVNRLETTVSLSVQREGRTTQGQTPDAVAEPLVESTRDDVYTPGLSVVGTSIATAAGHPVRLIWGGEIYRDILSSHGTVTDLLAGTVDPLVRATAAGAPVPSGRFPDGATMDRAGVFLAADALVHARLRLTAGGRWSAFRSEANVGADFGGAVANSASDLTGQLGAVLTLVRGLDLTFRVAEGFRAPNLYDLTNVGTVPGGIVLPNVNARPEEALSLEGSIRYGDARTVLDLTVYRTRIDDFIDRAPGTFQGDTLFRGERVFLGTNVAQATVRGIEAEVVRVHGPVSLRGTLLVTRGDQTVQGAEEPMAKIPPLGGTAGAAWRTAGGTWQVSYELRWAARQDRLGSRDLRDSRIPPGGTPGYAVHALAATGALTPGLTVSVGVENLTDTLYRTHASGVDAPGRHLWVGLTLFERLGP